jgi:hypothetical protein
MLSYILLLGKETESLLVQLSIGLCIISMVIGFCVGIGTIGAWNTSNRNKWLQNMYRFHASQLVLLFGAVLLLISEYTNPF